MFDQRPPISIASPATVSYPRTSVSWQPVVKYLLLIGGAVYLLASLAFTYFTYEVYNVAPKMVELEQRQRALESKQAELDKRLHASSSELKHVVTTGVDSAQQQIAARAAELENQQKAAVARLAAAQTQQSKQLADVSGEIGAVKNDIGTARADLQKTQTDLAATNAKLERAMGDLGVESGLLARNAQELEVLRHKGERNYYDFTLKKNARVAVSTVSLVLKKVDPAKSKFTLNVIADDKTIEKKDRTLNEPLQFYSGRDRLLFELVVFMADKNSITGYLSTPKDAPKPVTP
jgi:multidrug efflux pump subunit AcrA (membrane-fusion protein)